MKRRSKHKDGFNRHMERYNTVFLVEILAIKRYVDELSAIGKKDMTIWIRLDSQAVLKALEKSRIS